ncbi:hypothetical protein L208DRAFT_1417316 [Tricholoma matsutake]|nr:hypothetical protein L208DRAFT_1417316 [Tricholoma matsutake 945]
MSRMLMNLYAHVALCYLALLLVELLLWRRLEHHSLRSTHHWISAQVLWFSQSDEKICPG